MLGLSLALAGRCQVHVPRRGPPPGRGRSALGHGWAIGLWVPPSCRPARCLELLVGAAKPKRAEGRWAREERAAPIRPQRGAPWRLVPPFGPWKEGTMSGLAPGPEGSSRAGRWPMSLEHLSSCPCGVWGGAYS